MRLKTWNSVSGKSRFSHPSSNWAQPGLDQASAGVLRWCGPYAVYYWGLGCERAGWGLSQRSVTAHPVCAVLVNLWTQLLLQTTSLDLNFRAVAESQYDNHAGNRDMWISQWTNTWRWNCLRAWCGREGHPLLLKHRHLYAHHSAHAHLFP